MRLIVRHAVQEMSMPKIHSFELPLGFRVGHYEIRQPLGRGWTAEAYLATEVPTGATRVLKFYDRHPDRESIGNLRDFAYYCQVMERISHIGLLPRYYHFGHAFLKSGDGIGNYFIVQEYVAGSRFKRRACTDAMIGTFVEKVRSIHALGFGVGDIIPSNLLISEHQIRLVDLENGTHKRPFTNAHSDLKQIASRFGVRWTRA